jgi:hypothetical protein
MTQKANHPTLQPPKFNLTFFENTTINNSQLSHIWINFILTICQIKKYLSLLH